MPIWGYPFDDDMAEYEEAVGLVAELAELESDRRLEQHHAASEFPACPTCKGDGYVDHSSHNADGYRVDGGKTCPTCNGTGTREVPE